MIGRLFGRHLRERLDAALATLRDVEGQAAALRRRVEVLRRHNSDLAERAGLATSAQARADRMEHVARALYDAAKEADHGCGRDLGRACRLCGALRIAGGHLGARVEAGHYLGAGHAPGPEEPTVTVRRMIEYRGPRSRVEEVLAKSLPIGPTTWRPLRVTVAPLD